MTIAKQELEQTKVRLRAVLALLPTRWKDVFLFVYPQYKNYKRFVVSVAAGTSVGSQASKQVIDCMEDLAKRLKPIPNEDIK